MAFSFKLKIQKNYFSSKTFLSENISLKNQNLDINNNEMNKIDRAFSSGIGKGEKKETPYRI